MAKSIIEALRMFQKIGFNDVMTMSLDNNEKTIHSINHRFKEEICVPFVGLTNNISFIMSKGEKEVHCADGIVARVLEWEEKHICELEDDIQRLYGIGCWQFMCRWYKSEKRMDSMHFIKMKLEKL